MKSLLRRAPAHLLVVALGWSLCGAGLQAQEGLPDRRVADMFKPLSVPAELVNESAYFVLWMSLGIFVVVGGLLTYAVFRFRTPKDDDGSEPPQIYGSSHIELAWTVIPIILTIALIVVTARTIGVVQDADLPKDSMVVNVVGHQWWWEVRYPEYGIVTANEIHIPVTSAEQRRVTKLLLQSADVVHSFWVPQLAGKTDLLPNRDNHMWLEPRETGVYYGNCAEYCGTQHAHMLLRVIVESEEDFKKWVAEQQAPPVVDASVDKGRRLFNSFSCVSCHDIGTQSNPHKFGPDLTHLMSRQMIGSGTVKLTPENLHAWVKDPQDIKPGVLMPNMQMNPQEVDDIVAYLLTLK